MLFNETTGTFEATASHHMAEATLQSITRYHAPESAARRYGVVYMEYFIIAPFYLFSQHDIR